MAQVPYDGGAPTVAPETRAPDDYQRIDAKPEQFGGLIAKGEQQLGAGTEKAAESAFDASKFWGEVQTDGAVNNSLTAVNSTVAQFRALRGQQALDAQESTQKQIDDIFKQGRQGLDSPAQQRQYDETVRNYQQRYISGLLTTHADTEAKAHIAKTNQDSFGLAISGVANSAENQQSVLNFREDARAAAVKQVHAEGNGGDPTIVKAAIARADQAVFKTQIESVAVKDPKAATAIAEQRRAELGDQYDNVMNSLRARKQQQGGVEAGADAITRAQGGNTPIDLSRRSTFRSAPLSEVKGFIFHHTAGGGTPEGVVDTLNQRGLGVQYIMDREGQVYRALPNGARGAHVLPNVAMGLSNFNTEGMEIIAKNDHDVTPKQIEAVKQFSAAYNEAHPGVAFYGHGEVNPGHKEADEGATAVQAGSGRTVAAAAREGAGGRFAAFGRIGPEDDPRGMVPYIRAMAQKYGINPDAAVAVAKSEGLSGFKSGIPGENSFGAFQLNDKGMGAEFQKATGLDPSDPRNERATIDYAMKRASVIGNWGPWHGAKNRYGWTNEGIGNAGAGTLGASGAAPAYASRKADAYQIIADRTDLDHEEKVHAYQYVNQTINAQEIADNQQQRAKKQAVDHAAGSYFTEIIDAMHSPNPDYVALSGRINHDPALADDMHTKAALIDRIKKLSGEEESLGFGPGYLAARNGLFSAPDAPGHINDMTALAQRPDITMAGLSDLSKRWTLAKRSVDHGATERQVNFFLQDAKSKLSFEQDVGSLKIRDPKGEHIFNAEFAPKFVKRVSELADEAERTGDHKKLDDFLTSENISKMIRSFRDPRQMAAERLSATGEAAGDSGGNNNEPLPPTPEGLNPAAWVPLVRSPPRTASGKLWPLTNWAENLEHLHNNPTPEVKEVFDRRFGKALGLTADQVIAKLSSGKAPVEPLSASVPAAPPPASGPPAASPASPAATPAPDETGRPRTGPERAETARLQAEENLRARAENRSPRDIPVETPEQAAAWEGRRRDAARVMQETAAENARAMRKGVEHIPQAQTEARTRMITEERTNTEAELAELDKNEKEAKPGTVTALQKHALDRRRAALKARLEALPRE